MIFYDEARATDRTRLVSFQYPAGFYGRYVPKLQRLPSVSRQVYSREP